MDKGFPNQPWFHLLPLLPSRDYKVDQYNITQTHFQTSCCFGMRKGWIPSLYCGVLTLLTLPFSHLASSSLFLRPAPHPAQDPSPTKEDTEGLTSPYKTGPTQIMETYTKKDKEKKAGTHTKLDVIPKSPATPTLPMPGSSPSPKPNKG